jgi:hypothetical protein
MRGWLFAARSLAPSSFLPDRIEVWQGAPSSLDGSVSFTLMTTGAAAERFPRRGTVAPLSGVGNLKQAGSLCYFGCRQGSIGILPVWRGQSQTGWKPMLLWASAM